MDLVTKIHHCDIISWSKDIPVNIHQSCIDGLCTGIKWLEVIYSFLGHSSVAKFSLLQKKPTDNILTGIISDLQLVKEKLQWNFCASIITNPVLRVFEDPGIDFFDLRRLHDDFLVVLTSDDTRLVPLYLRYGGDFYNLSGRSWFGLPSEIIRHEKGPCRHGFIALHCARSWKHDNPMSSPGVRYAAKYWAKHAYLADPAEVNSLKKIRWIISKTKPLAEQDQLYHQVLMAYPLQHRTTLLHIVGFILLRNPAFEYADNISLIEELLDLSPDEVANVLERMSLFFTTTTAPLSKSPIRLFHASFGDYIFNRRRSGPFFIDRQSETQFLAIKCIDYMGRRREQGRHRCTRYLLTGPMLIFPWIK